jgi:hypothetical protein
MNPLIQLKKATPVFLVALVCFGLLRTMQAVSPPPDGGYPGGNTAEGQNALLSLTTGGYNTAVGFLSLRSNTTGSANTAIGAGTLFANTGNQNTATGFGALLRTTSGGFNTATGALALLNNTTGVSNTANGLQALIDNTAGGENTATGTNSLVHNTTGSGNTALGLSAGANVTTADNVICIGYSVLGANVSNTCFIGSIRGQTTGNNDAIPVLIDSNSQLGTASSSRRYKTDIKPIDKASESILALKPVSFRYKVHKDTTPQFGLIAEDVAEVNPNLVIYDADSKPYTVRYEAVNAMLLNEFLKEHRKVEEMEKAMVVFSTQLREQAAQIQKVSAQLEASKPAPRVVNNP